MTSEILLRPWQREALAKSESWLLSESGDNRFLINAAPGSGKTICASVIAKRLIELDLVDRVVVIAPRRQVVKQWAQDFKFVTGRDMLKITNPDGIEDFGLDLCATWSAVQGLLDGFQLVCQSARTLVICDEHHHAAVEATWGRGAGSAFEHAEFALLLTGTPVRSDGNETVWLAYDDRGRIDHAPEGTYTLTYGEAVDLGYCRPVTFHRHEGKFSVDFGDGTALDVTSKRPAELDKDLKKIPQLQRALDFYRLACTPSFESDGKTPTEENYHTTMIDWAISKLDRARDRLPNAGGLIIAPTIAIAEYFAEIIERLDGEKPTIVHSDAENSEAKIEGFKRSTKRWLVSVAMVSEGVDIPRLRILVYLPKATTELAFRQAIGRVVRTAGPDDDSRAYVIMPSFDIFENYARRIEHEMPESYRKDGSKKTKKCPACYEENPLTATRCGYCSYDFPQSFGGRSYVQCSECETLNPRGVSECQNCGAPFSQVTEQFVVTLKDALRTGAIVRGMELSEEEVVEGEAMADEVFAAIYDSGDESIIRLLKGLPEEAFGKLNSILSQVRKPK